MNLSETEARALAAYEGGNPYAHARGSRTRTRYNLAQMGLIQPIAAGGFALTQAGRDWLAATKAERARFSK